jgi:hypothetical protein
VTPKLFKTTFALVNRLQLILVSRKQNGSGSLSKKCYDISFMTDWTTKQLAFLRQSVWQYFASEAWHGFFGKIDDFWE